MAYRQIHGLMPRDKLQAFPFANSQHYSFLSNLETFLFQAIIYWLKPSFSQSVHRMISYIFSFICPFSNPLFSILSMWNPFILSFIHPLLYVTQFSKLLILRFKEAASLSTGCPHGSNPTIYPSSFSPFPLPLATLFSPLFYRYSSWPSIGAEENGHLDY